MIFFTLVWDVNDVNEYLYIDSIVFYIEMWYEWFTDIIMFCIDYLLCFSYTSTIIKISGRSYVKWLFLKILISLYFSVCFSSHFIPFHLLFKFSLEIIRRVRSFNFFYSSRHLSWIIWASFKVKLILCIY